MGHDGIHPQALRELAESAVRTLVVVFGRSQHRVLRAGGKQVSFTSSRRARQRDAGDHRLASLTLIAGKVSEHIMLETVSTHITDKVIGSSQRGFMKGKSCLTNLPDFYNKMICSVNKGRAMNDLILTLARLSALSPLTAS